MRLRRAWWRVRRWLANWWPDPVEGVGFAVTDEMSCGELGLELNVEGRKGTVYLSRVMWLTIGAKAGWVTEEEAEAAWEEESRQIAQARAAKAKAGRPPA